MVLSNRLRRFFDSRGYIILTAVLVFLAHSTLRVNDQLLFGGYQEFLFGGLLIASVAAGCLVCADLRFFLMPVMSVTFMIPTVHGPNIPYYSKFYLEHIPLTLEYILVLLIVGGLLCFIARNRPNRGVAHSRIFVGLALFSGALMLNGIGSRYYCFADMIYPLTMVAALVGFYLLFAAYVRFDRSVFDYFMTCVLALGLMITSQLVFTFLDPGPDGMRFTASGGIDKVSLLFGWGNSNAMGGMLAFLMPSGFYYAHSHRNGWLGLLAGGVMYLGVVMSQSRGALLAATVTLVLSFLLLLSSGRNRKVNGIFTLLIILAAAGVAVVFRSKIIHLVRTMLDLGLADRGRFEIWSTAIEKFREYPIFGAGFYTDFSYVDWHKDVYPYLYHNTPLQVLSSGGAVAFAAYLWHRFTTVRLVFRKPDPYKSFLGLCVLGLLVFCLLEVIFFSTYPTIIYALMLLFMEKKDAFPDVPEAPNPIDKGGDIQ